MSPPEQALALLFTQPGRCCPAPSCPRGGQGCTVPATQAGPGHHAPSRLRLRAHAQVLFCKLTTEQAEMYRAYLASTEVAEILEGNRHVSARTTPQCTRALRFAHMSQAHTHVTMCRAQALAGIDILRKICNHADLLERTRAAAQKEYGACRADRALGMRCCSRRQRSVVCAGAPVCALRCLCRCLLLKQGRVAGAQCPPLHPPSPLPHRRA